jgi:hypothetical protein
LLVTFASMKKITSYLFSFFAILLFLASSTGISFVIHHCSDNHTSEFHLFASDYQCDHEKSECGCNSSTDEDHETEDCKINNQQKCCSNTKGYFKVTDNYDFSRYEFNFNALLQTEVSRCTISDQSQLFINYHFIYYSPPLLLSGQDILIHNSQLII